MSKASCGALESFHLTRVPSFLSYHKLLKSAGARFLGTSDADSAIKYKKPLMDLRDLKVQPKEKVVIVLGDEGVGVSEEVIDNCDLLLSINSANSKKTSVNSLNVSVVADEQWSANENKPDEENAGETRGMDVSTFFSRLGAAYKHITLRRLKKAKMRHTPFRMSETVALEVGQSHSSCLVPGNGDRKSSSDSAER
ncbi:unnamed protein product [Heligmosomoides polygyrus]|uniref:SpoU_methylase domain-containing protein n=1 Tax=Heligmosomoides polygyrus TaxID=6339 RepID=A0A183FT48_HELPZ|nr:unnamed protein product [Heligmosomoides polygyrus]